MAHSSLHAHTMAHASRLLARQIAQHMALGNLQICVMRDQYFNGAADIPDKAAEMRPWIDSIPVFAWHYISAGHILTQSTPFPNAHPGAARLAAIKAGLAEVRTCVLQFPSSCVRGHACMNCMHP